MGRVFLIRHGATAWSHGDQRFCGTTNLELSEAGLREAELAADRLAREPLAAVYATSLARSRQTAQAIAARHRLQVQIATELREADFGEWEGLNYVEIAERFPELNAARASDPTGIAPPGGENLNQVIARAVPALMALAERHSADEIALVGHNTTNRVLLCHFLDVPLANYRRVLQSPAAINVLEFADGVVRVISVNDTCHLGTVGLP
jgi:broad specificity phosphatase PhoE